MEVEPWFLQSKREVDLPVCEALTLPEDEFQVYLSTLNQWTLRDLYGKESTVTAAAEESEDQMKDADDDTFTLVSEQPSTTADIREQVNRVGLEDEENIDVSSATDTAETAPASADHPFMAGLLSFQPNQPEVGEMDNKMLTENGDIANRSTNEPLLDLFTELEDVISGPRLLELLNQAWKKDPLATLKIIFNARSIHLGKASRHTFYRCAGWLGQHHPRTLVASLPWLSRPVIEKKVQKKEDGEDDVVMAQEPPQEDDAARYDVRFGVSHGYWKDLLNLLALSVNDHCSPWLNQETFSMLKFGQINQDQNAARCIASGMQMRWQSSLPTRHTILASEGGSSLRCPAKLRPGNTSRQRQEEEARNINLCQVGTDTEQVSRQTYLHRHLHCGDHVPRLPLPAPDCGPKQGTLPPICPR